MSALTQIQHRHGRDHWTDALFIGVAALLIALSIGATTSKGAGSAGRRAWSVTVVEGAVEVVK